MNLMDSVVFITGGGSGIGAAGAKLFAKRGARVCLVARDENQLQEQVEEIEAAGGKAIFHAADVRDEEAVKAAVDATVDKWGQLDICWANAGIGGISAPIDRIMAEEWDEVLEINLRGTFFTIKHAVPHMKERGGAIIITSSTSGTRTFTDMGATPYAASKAGQVSMMKMLSVELGAHGIRVNALCPGATETKLGESGSTRAEDELKRPVEYPEGDMPLEEDNQLDPKDVALAAVLLAEADAITGTAVYTAGGQSLIT